jgi:hypothetical protein
LRPIVQMRSPPSSALKIDDVGDHSAIHPRFRRGQNIRMNNVDIHVRKACGLSFQSGLLAE